MLLSKIINFGFVILLAPSAFALTSNSTNHRNWISQNQKQNDAKHTWITNLNPIAQKDFNDVDVSKNFTYPSTASQLRAGNGGDITITNFMNLLYLEFLNPLAKANPDLNIPAEPTDLPAFFLNNGIETKRGTLENHDGDTWNSISPYYFPSSYPTTKAILKILNLLLVPLDTAPGFKQLAAQAANGNWNSENGFFNQFINYVITRPIQAAQGVYFYGRYFNATNLSNGVFDFDAGYYTLFNPAEWSTVTIGIDTNNQTIKTLSDQINNFMFLLDSYVNFAVELLNNMKQIEPNPVGQWLMLNNLTKLGTFNTPKLFDAAALADGRTISYDDQNGGAVSIFTALPRFMINASYGEGPNHGRTRNWGATDNHYMMLLHYNGLASGYLNVAQQHNDFVHSSSQNTGHYYTYTDTSTLNSLIQEEKVLGELMFWYAWNAEINYLANFNLNIFDNICMNAWPNIPNSTIKIPKDALLVQQNDRNQSDFFDPSSITKQFLKTFNAPATAKIAPFTNHFIALWNGYNTYNYGFLFYPNGNKIQNNYVDLLQIASQAPFTPYVLNSYDSREFGFETEQTTLLFTYNQQITQLYRSIDLGYRHHVNGQKLMYLPPDLITTAPATFKMNDKWDLYNYYVTTPDSADSYYDHFKSEQRQIKQENNNDVPKKHFQSSAWLITTIIFIIVTLTSGVFILYLLLNVYFKRKNLTWTFLGKE